MAELDRTLRDLVVDHRVVVLDPFFAALSYAGSFGFIWLAIAFRISGFSWSRPWLWTRVGAAILVAELLGPAEGTGASATARRSPTRCRSRSWTRP